MMVSTLPARADGEGANAYARPAGTAPSIASGPPCYDLLRGRVALNDWGSGYSDLDAFFLVRLYRLIRLRTVFERSRAEEAARFQLVESGLRSTLGDCDSLGLTAEARALFELDGPSPEWAKAAFPYLF